MWGDRLKGACGARYQDGLTNGRIRVQIDIWADS
jgi:hypothetical protein